MCPLSKMHKSLNCKRECCSLERAPQLLNVMARELNRCTPAVENTDSREALACSGLPADIILDA